MNHRLRWKPLGGVALAAAATIAMAIAPAGGVDTEDVTLVVGVSGDATGAWASIEDDTDFYDVGPAPQVVLPPEGGGPFTDSLASLTVDTPTPTPFTGALEVSTEGALGVNGFAESSAIVDDVDPDDAGLLIASASRVEVECRADATGVSGSTTITDGVSIFPASPTLIPETPPPNTVVWSGVEEAPFGFGAFRATGELVVNEQVVDGDSIRVVGMHAQVVIEFVIGNDPPIFLIETEMIVGEVACGVETEQVPPEPPGPPTPPAPSGAAEAVAVAPRFTG